MPNAFLTRYRQDIADLGATDDRPDWMVMRDDLIPLAQKNPALLDQYPDFAQEFGDYREANAPSLATETGHAVKSGTQALFSDLDAAAALGLKKVGLDQASGYMLGRARELQDLSAENPPTIPTMQDIGPGRTGADRFFSKDTARYAAAKLGGALPALAEIAGLGAAGGILGSAAEPGVGTVVGAGEGVVEGILGRGIIKSAISALKKKAEKSAIGAIAEGATEDEIANAIRAGNEGIAKLVTKEAQNIAAGRAGEVAALGLGAYPLSAGGIYKETGDENLAAGLGVVGALAGAPPIIGLPARVVRSLFPRLTGEAATSAANELVGKKTSELLAKLGRAGIAVGTGTASTVGMEATNIVAKNITQGKDALELDAQDWNRLREAAVGGALASLPFAGLAARSPEQQVAAETNPPGAPPAGEVLPPPAIEPPPVAPAPRTRADIYREVTRMAPDAQTGRIAELEAKPTRTPDEDAELELLRVNAPPPATPSAPAPVVPAAISPSPIEAGAGAVPPREEIAAPVSTTEITPEVAKAEAGAPQFSFKDAGYETPEAFQTDYAQKHIADVFETSDEFLMRVFCSAQP